MGRKKNQENIVVLHSTNLVCERLYNYKMRSLTTKLIMRKVIVFVILIIYIFVLALESHSGYGNFSIDHHITLDDQKVFLNTKCYDECITDYLRRFSNPHLQRELAICFQVCQLICLQCYPDSVLSGCRLGCS